MSRGTPVRPESGRQAGALLLGLLQAIAPLAACGRREDDNLHYEGLVTWAARAVPELVSETTAFEWHFPQKNVTFRSLAKGA